MDRRWDKSKPPSGPWVLNRDCKLAQNLQALFLPFDGVPALVYDHVTRSAPTVAGTIAATVDKSTGAGGLDMSATSGDRLSYVYGSSGIPIITNRAISCFARIAPAVLTRGDLINYWGIGANTTWQFNLLYGLTSGKPQFYVTNDAGTLLNSGVGSTAMATGSTYVVGGVANTSSIEVWLDGSLQASAASSSTTPNTSPSGNSLVVGDNSNGDGNFNGGMFAAGLWNRSLTADDWHALTYEMYGLCYPLRSKKWFSAGAVLALADPIGAIASGPIADGPIAGGTTASAAGTTYTLACAAGSYSLTGIDATLTYTPGQVDYVLTCDAGSYTLAGQAATLTLARNLALAAGSYELTGQASTAVLARKVALDAGSYALTGNDATLEYTTTAPVDYTLACDAGSYTISGGDASLDLGSGLIGRKYPRRGRSRPRKVLPQDDIAAVSEQITREKEQLTEELASAQADLVSIRLMADNNVRRTEKIEELSGVISTLEHNIKVRQEEEVLMMLACMSLEL